MRSQRLRRWTVFVGAAVIFVAAIVALVFVFGDRPTHIDYYRVTGDRTLVVGTTTGPAKWTRTVVQENPASVTITVRAYDVGPGSAVGYPVEMNVVLEQPLGGRHVLDGSDMSDIVETRCPRPQYLAPGCVVDQ